MLDFSTKHLRYTFPLDATSLKYSGTGGYVEAEIVQLTRWLAYWRVENWWGPRNYRPDAVQYPEDSRWVWSTKVRRLRKKSWVRCAAIRTPDGKVQGAVIYRRDGASLLQPNTGAVYVEYLAAAPWNRPDAVPKRLYLGVGEALLLLSIVHSYDWGLGGRVALFSLPSAFGFYKKYDFVETGEREGRMIHYELTPERAVGLLKDKGLIQ